MKKYTIGLITGALLAVSAMMCMGAQNKNLGDITVNSITVLDDGNGGFITTYNADGKETVFLGTGEGGVGILSTSNADGKETAYLGTNIDRSGYVTTYNANGNRNAYLGFGKGGGRLITFETDGKKTIYLGTNIEGSGGHLETFNKHEVQTGYFGTIKNNDGVAALFDRYGDEGWSASGNQ